jgi:predicted dehydrogenase
MNHVTNDGDRSYNALIEFEDGARGIYNAQWYAPGGWRVALYGDGISIICQPIEEAVVLVQGRRAEPLRVDGFDAKFKPGLYGQAEAFAALVADGRLPDGAADLDDYVRSVALVDRLTDAHTG